MRWGKYNKIMLRQTVSNVAIPTTSQLTVTSVFLLAAQMQTGKKKTLTVCSSQGSSPVHSSSQGVLSNTYRSALNVVHSSFNSDVSLCKDELPRTDTESAGNVLFSLLYIYIYICLIHKFSLAGIIQTEI